MAAAAPYTDPNDPLGSPDSTQDPAEAAYRRALLAQVAGPPKQTPQQITVNIIQQQGGTPGGAQAPADATRLQALDALAREMGEPAARPGTAAAPDARQQGLDALAREMGQVAPPPGGTAPPAGIPRRRGGAPPDLGAAPTEAPLGMPAPGSAYVPPLGATRSGGQPALGPPPSSIANQSPATMRQTLDARAKALAATNDDLARMYKGIAIEQQHQRDAPWSFDAARTLKLQQDEQTYETMRQQHLGELKQQQIDRKHYMDLPIHSVPETPEFTWQPPPVYGQVDNFKKLLDTSGPVPLSVKKKLQTQYDTAHVALASGLKQEGTAIQQRQQSLKLIAPQLAALNQQAKAGSLSPGTVAWLNQKLQAYDESSKVLAQQSREYVRQAKRYDDWAQSHAGKLIHGGRYYPWELDDHGNPKADDNLATRAEYFLTPITGIARQHAKQIQGNMQITGEYPPLPDLPDNITPEQKTDLTRKKNSLFNLVNEEYAYWHPGKQGGISSTNPEFGGVDPDALKAQQFRDVTTGLRNLTPYQQKLLPIVRAQVAAIQKSESQAGLLKAGVWDAGTALVAEMAGLATSYLGGKLILRYAPPALAELLTGSVLGQGFRRGLAKFGGQAAFHYTTGALGGFGAGTVGGTGAGLFMGMKPLPALKLGAQMGARNAPIAGGVAAALGVGQIAGRTLADAGLFPRGGTPAGSGATPPPYQPEGPGRPGVTLKVAPGPKPPAVGTVLEDPRMRMQYEFQGEAPDGTWNVRIVKGAPHPDLHGAEMALSPEGQWRVMGGGTGAAGEPLPPAPKRGTVPGVGKNALTIPTAPGRARTVTTTVIPPGPQINDPLGQPVNLRTATPDTIHGLIDGLSVMGGRAGEMPPERATDLARAQAFARDVDNYEQQRTNPPIPFTDPRIANLWGGEEGKPAKSAYQTLYNAGVAAREKGNDDAFTALTTAAKNVRQSFTFNAGYNQVGPDSGIEPLPPPSASPYRFLDPAVFKKLPEPARTALLIDDYNNSVAALDPTAAAAYRVQDIPGATSKNLQSLADEQYAVAQSHAALAYPNDLRPVAVAPPAPAAQVTPHGQAMQAGEAQRLGLEQPPLPAAQEAAAQPQTAAVTEAQPAPRRALTAAEGKTAQHLAERPGEYVTVAGLAKERGIKEASAEKHLRELGARGAIALPSGPQAGTPHYQYHAHRLFDLLNKEDQEQGLVQEAPAPVTIPEAAVVVRHAPPPYLAPVARRAAAHLAARPGEDVITAARLANELSITPAEAARTLKQLHEKGLLKKVQGRQGPTYFYQPHREELQRAAEHEAPREKPAAERQARPEARPHAGLPERQAARAEARKPLQEAHAREKAALKTLETAVRDEINARLSGAEQERALKLVIAREERDTEAAQLLNRAGRYAIETGRTLPNQIARALHVTPAQAIALIAELTELGILGAEHAGGQRRLLVENAEDVARAIEEERIRRAADRLMEVTPYEELPPDLQGDVGRAKAVKPKPPAVAKKAPIKKAPIKKAPIKKETAPVAAPREATGVRATPADIQPGKKLLAADTGTVLEVTKRAGAKATVKVLDPGSAGLKTGETREMAVGELTVLTESYAERRMGGESEKRPLIRAQISGHTIVLGDGLTEADVTPAMREWMGKIGPVVQQVVREIALRGLDEEERGRLGDVGLILRVPEETGVTMGVAVKEGGKTSLYFSPFVPSVETKNGETTATWATNEDDARRAAAQMLQTIYHELSHLKTMAEGEALFAAQTEIMGKVPWQLTARAMQRLRAILEGEDGGLAGTYREARAGYLEIKRPAGGAGVRGAGLGEPGTGQSGREYRERRLPGGEGGPLKHARQIAGRVGLAKKRTTTPKREPDPRIAPEISLDDRSAGDIKSESETLSTWLKRQLAELKKYPHLSDVLDADLAHFLDVHEKQRAISQLQATLAQTALVSHMDENELRYYRDALLALDRTEEIAVQTKRIREQNPDYTEAEAESRVLLERGVNALGQDVEWTVPKVRIALADVMGQIDQHGLGRVKKAIADRRLLRTKILEPWLAANTKLFGHAPEFDRVEYVHHEIRAYRAAIGVAAGAGMGRATSTGSVEADQAANRGFTKLRTGQTQLPWVTNPVQADLFWMVPMIHDTQVMEMLAYVLEHYDQTPNLAHACMTINHENALRWAEKQAGLINADLAAGKEPLTAEDVFKREFQPERAEGFWMLGHLAALGQLPRPNSPEFDSVIDRLQLNHVENEARRLAGSSDVIEFSGTPEEQQAMYRDLARYLTWLASLSKRKGVGAAKKVLADKVSAAQIKAKANLQPVTPEMLLLMARQRQTDEMWGKGFYDQHELWRFLDVVAWRPSKTSSLERAHSAPDRARKQLAIEGLMAAGKTEEQATRAAEMDPTIPQSRIFYIPRRIAQTLEDVGEHQASHPLDRALGNATGLWAWSMLYTFPHIFSYNLRNLFGDVGRMQLVRPGTFLTPKGIRRWNEAEEKLRMLLWRKEVPEVGLTGEALAAQEKKWGRFLEWIDMGGLKAAFVQNFGGTDSRLPFELLKVSSESRPFLSSPVLNAARVYIHTAEGIATYRESIGRLALYLEYWDELQAQVDAKTAVGEEIVWKKIQPSDYGGSNPQVIDALTSVKAKAWGLSNEASIAYDKSGRFFGKLRTRLDMPFARYPEGVRRMMGNVGLNVVRGSAEYQAALERTETEFGARLVDLEMAPPKIPPPPQPPPPPPGGGEPPGPGDDEWEEYQRRRAAWVKGTADLKRLHALRRQRWRVWLRQAQRFPEYQMAVYRQIGKTALGLAVPIGAAVAWNKADFDLGPLHVHHGQKFENLPEYARSMGGFNTIMLPGAPAGQVWSFDTGSGLYDVLSPWGFADTMGWKEMALSGKLSVPNILGFVAQNQGAAIVQQIGPAKSVVEVATGKKYYPNAFDPRGIRDKTEYVAQQFGLGGLYRKVTGKPAPLGAMAATGGFVTSHWLGVTVTDMLQNNYFEVLAYRDAWSKGQPTMHPHDPDTVMDDEKKNALYWMQRSIDQKQYSMADGFLAQYLALGGSAKTLFASLSRQDPLFGMSPGDRKRFLVGGTNAAGLTTLGLDDNMKAKLKGSYWFLYDRMPGAPMEAFAREALNQLPVDEFAKTVEPMLKRRMGAYAADMGRRLQQAHPEIREEQQKLNRSKAGR